MGGNISLLKCLFNPKYSVLYFAVTQTYSAYGVVTTVTSFVGFIFNPSSGHIPSITVQKTSAASW